MTKSAILIILSKVGEPKKTLVLVFGSATKMGLVPVQQPTQQYLSKSVKNVNNQKEWEYGDVIKTLMDLI